jgi:hypothetical protein
MRRNAIRLIITFLFCFFAGISFGQNVLPDFPTEAIRKFNQEALGRIKAGENIDITGNRNGSVIRHSPLTALNYWKKDALPLRALPEKKVTVFRSDTLFLADTLEVSGPWTLNGAIVIYSSGYLHLHRADATILGDIFLLDNAKFQVDSSTLYIPQAYFYQRAILATGGSNIIFSNTDIDHSGLSHNIILFDSARLEYYDVTNHGFTTSGIYGKASVYIDGTNEAGEFVILNEANLEFHNAGTVLPWHQFPDSSIINFSFPDGDTLEEYEFNPTLAGVSGVDYTISIHNCTEVMWGMMPATGSDVTISDSDIRAIGLWFLGSDSLEVTGLVNNSSYEDFTAPLNDRNLRLTGCEVTTWSLYPMEEVDISLSACILGEIGTMGRSTLNGTLYFCDGSGGYVWSNDTTFLVTGFSFTNGYVRSQGNSILLYGYSSLNNGYPSALGNSVIMTIQCALMEEPRYYDKSVAWNALITGPADAYPGESVAITGSVWIDKSPESSLMDFGKYQLFYQAEEEEVWIQIPADSLNEKRNETLGLWETGGLAPGQYILRLVLHDDLGNAVEALKAVNLLYPTAIDENNATDLLTVKLPLNPKAESIFIANINGKLLLHHPLENALKEQVSLSIKDLPAGVYLVTVEFKDNSRKSMIFTKM